MPRTFDPTKPVQTRDGRPARIICTDATDLLDGPEYTIVAIVNGRPYAFTADGQFFAESLEEEHYDLVNVPERVERFFGVSSTIGRLGPSCATAEDARKHPWERKIRTILRIAYEDGLPVEVELIHGED